MSEQPSRLRSVGEWAKELACSPETILRAIRRKELLAHRHPTRRGRPWQVRASDINHWLEGKRSGRFV